MLNSAELEAAIERLHVKNPDALRLAELVSLAARIEPELLRAARLDLTRFDAASEADLWFSSLVETRTADWIALDTAAARELRSRLATDESRLAAARALIMEVHQGAPATILLEEEIQWLALTSLSDSELAIDSRLRLVLGKLLEDPVAHKGLANWFAGAAQRLPVQAQATEAYALLSFISSGLLDGRLLGSTAAVPPLASLADTFPTSIPKLRLWATLTEAALILRPNHLRGFVPLEVPRTNPLLVELRQSNQPHRLIALNRGETKSVSIKQKVVELYTAAGDAYQLRYRPQELFSNAAQGLVLGFGGTGAHIITKLKELSVFKHGSMPETLKFLLIDTIPDWSPGKTVQIMGSNEEERTAFGVEDGLSINPIAEYFELTDFPPDLKTHINDYLSPDGYAKEYRHLKDWFHAPWLTRSVPQSRLGISMGASHQRQIARYAMVKNADMIITHLRPVIRKLSDLRRGAAVNVWLIASSAGGTGAGSLIDAAYLTRLAAGNDVKMNLTGVVILPNVYMNVSGVRRDRAYSLFRELERVQEQGIPRKDRYVEMSRGEVVSSRVVYDSRGKHTAMVSGRLFDDLFYLGTDCATEADRVQFFSSVASALDPFLDSSSGPVLREKAVNEMSAASAFGASSIYVPTDTFAEMFAWEQVAKYLTRACAPREMDDRVVGLHSGGEQDRAENGWQKFRNLSTLFKELLDLAHRPARFLEMFAREELDARRIVTVWYELNASRGSRDEQSVMLSYLDPYFSLTESERPSNPGDFEVKTYRENAQHLAGTKETQERSRDRFVTQLDEITRRYTSRQGGERTFEKGRKRVGEIVSERLLNQLDHLFIDELMQGRSDFAQSEQDPREGTVLTRLFAEASSMLRESGPIHTMRGVIAQFRRTVADQLLDQEDHFAGELMLLRESRRSGWLDFGAWVEEYQRRARDAASAYVRYYQKYELLKDTEHLVSQVENRLRDWQRLLAQFFNELVLDESGIRDDGSALFKAKQIHLNRILRERVHRLARSRTFLTSFGEQPDPDMHGYTYVLRKQSAFGLAAQVLSQSRWEAAVNTEGVPTLTLVIEVPELARHYRLSEIKWLPEQLYEFFHKEITQRLRETDVFDYLIWLDEQTKVSLKHIASELTNRANTLVKTSTTRETSILIYRGPANSRKRERAESLASYLIPVEVEPSSADRNSITLLKIRRPTLDQLTDLQQCRSDYLALRDAALNNDPSHDVEVRRAQVFHTFRQEMEAWYIERAFNRSGSAHLTLPPRVVRLLEDPEMMQIFVHAIATGVIEGGDRGWVWHGPERMYFLTADDATTSVDLVNAAIIFCLRQGEGRYGGRRRITREAGRQSINSRLQIVGKTLDAMLSDFVNNNLDKFLEDNAPLELREALKMVFTFYCDPNTRTSLEFRDALP